MEFFKRHTPWLVAFALLMLFIGCFQVLFSPPGDFPEGSIVTIARGASAPAVAKELADMHIVAHPSVFRFLLRVSGTSGLIQSGAYNFEKRENAISIALRLATGAYGLPPVRVTFTEGTTAREAAEQIADALPGIPEKDFLKEAAPYEGYLFPDTYFFPPSSDAESVVALMRANFDMKIATITDEITASGRSISDVVTLASLVEKEARTQGNRRIIAGIMLNRLKLGMPLQVDAVFGYIFGRDTYSPSFADLKVDSPYNTYLHTGLPPGPIDNPGLDSIEAVLHPTKTDYLYYLTGNDGLMHYATTYAGHQVNQRKYLN